MIEVQLAFTQPQKVRNLKSPHKSGGFLDVLPEEKIQNPFFGSEPGLAVEL